MNSLGGYKETGIDWISEIPVDWNISRSKFLFKNKSLKNFSDEPLLSVTQLDGVVVRSDSNRSVWNPADDVSGYKLIEPGDFVISLRSFEGGLELSDLRGLVSPAYTVLQPIRNIDDHYFRWLMKSYQFIIELNKHVTGIRQGKNIGWDDFSNIYLTTPPSDEQKLISRYLDKKTEQIDRLVEKIKKKIELLKEQRTSLINQCVTKGLDTNVEMKDSGVKWIGKIPKHWKFRKLKHFFRYKKGSLGQQLTSTFISENLGQFPVYSGQTENNGVLGMWDNHEFDYSDDVIFCTTVGAKLMTTRVVSGKFSLSQNCLIMIPLSNEIKSKYINYFLMYDFKIRKDLLPSILQPSLRMEDLDQYCIPVPPISEQSSIIEYLVSLMDNSEELIRKLETKETLLKKYRQSLISSAVTGKVRVTEDMI